MRRSAIFAVLILLCSIASAQQLQDFDDYEIHYNALNTNNITPQVAQSYGIRRSSSRALLNITVLKKESGQQGKPVQASVKASVRNLTGQFKEVEVREITDSEDAIYYIGEFSVRNLETFDFTVKVTPQGSEEELEVKFRKQFYTE